MKHLILFLLPLLAAVWTAVCAEADTTSLKIVQTTDIHGCMGGEDRKPGLARLGTIIERERAGLADGEELLLIDCGDLTLGSFTVTVDHGASMIQGLNALRYDAWVPGNHDFDYGTDALKARMKEFRGTVLAANLELAGAEKGLFTPWKMFRKNGLNVAVVGIVPPYLAQWIAPEQLEGVRLEFVEKALSRVMGAVMAAKPDVIVLAIHLGELISGRLTPEGKTKHMSRIAAEWPQINLILGGHTHLSVPGKKFYPNVWYSQAGAISESVSVTTLRYDKRERRVVSLESHLIPAAGEAENPKVKAILDPVNTEAAKRIHTKLAYFPGKLEPVKSPLARNRLAELLCRAMAEYAGTEGAFSTSLSNYVFNGGPMTELHLFLLTPYQNYISTVSFSPKQMKAVLEDPATRKYPKSALSATGIRFKRKADGTLDGPMIREKTGKPWTNEEERIVFAAGSFALSGAGGRAPELKRAASAPESMRKGTPLTVRDALREHVKKRYPYIGKKGVRHDK